jgi:hypothetical protein
MVETLAIGTMPRLCPELSDLCAVLRFRGMPGRGGGRMPVSG